MSLYNVDLGSMPEMAGDLMEQGVELAVYHTLIRQKAAELGCLPTDAQVQAARDEMKKNGEEDYQLMKDAFGLSDESVEYLFLTDTYYDNVRDALFPAATDEMLNSYAYQAKHILLLTVDMSAQPTQQEDGSYAYPALPAEKVAEQKKLAEDLLAQLQAAEDQLPLVLERRRDILSALEPDFSEITLDLRPRAPID